LIEKCSPDLDVKIFIAIMIAIENLIRIDRDPIFLFFKWDPFPGKIRTTIRSDVKFLGAR